MNKEDVHFAILKILESHRLPMSVDQIIKHMMEKSRGYKPKSNIKKEVINVLKDDLYREVLLKKNGKIVVKRLASDLNEAYSVDACVVGSNNGIWERYRYGVCSACPIMLRAVNSSFILKRYNVNMRPNTRFPKALAKKKTRKPVRRRKLVPKAAFKPELYKAKSRPKRPKKR